LKYKIEWNKIEKSIKLMKSQEGKSKERNRKKRMMPKKETPGNNLALPCWEVIRMMTNNDMNLHISTY
jgi:hypothetical protein